MKFINKSVLAVAVVGALVSGNAMAQAEIQAVNTVYAKEIRLPATLQVPLSWTVGYNFNENETRYACVRLIGGKFNSEVKPDVIESDANAGEMSAGTVNITSNDEVAFFTVSAEHEQTTVYGPTKLNVIQLGNIGVDVTSYNDTIEAVVGLYDNPSTAGQCPATATSSQLIPNSFDRAELISFKKSFEFKIDPNKLLASVEANPSFSAFAASPVVNNGKGWLNTVSLKLVQNPGLIADGSRAITLADIFPTTSTLTLNGDFSWADDVQIYDPNNSAYITATGDEEKATADLNVTAGFMGYTEVTPGVLDVDGNPVEIPAGAYTAELSVIPNAGYSLKADGSAGAVTLIPAYDEAMEPDDNSVDVALQADGAAGQIDQDGVRLMTPLVQLAGGQWLARLAISNTGSKDREFSLKVQGFDSEGASSTVSVIGDNKYVVKAGTTYVFDDLSNTLEFTGRARGTVTAIVAGPESEIKGVYQLVNTGANTISNINMINQTGGQGH